MNIHLGCGKHPLPGWINLDLELGHDLRNGIPAPNASADLIWAEHFIEHLKKEDALALLKDCFRVLKPHGEISLVTPDLKFLARAYLENNLKAFDRIAHVWAPLTSCDMMNQGMREWGHEYLWDQDELAYSLKISGFIAICVKSERPEYAVRPACGDFLITAKKPAP
jgi:predicted SAM-dependent methyltransferase